MDESFRPYLENLQPKLERLLSMEPISKGVFQNLTVKSGVYLFSEGATNLYVGQSNNVLKRYLQHFNPSSDRFAASFAFEIAKQEPAEIIKKPTDKNIKNWDFSQCKRFKDNFKIAKERVRDMEFRYVEENNHIKQTLLEIYCAVVLRCEYREFKSK